ncbi:hypothetical protein, partial [Roseivivax sp.]
LGPYAGLVLLQDANDLLFAETAFPHRLSPRLENRLTSNRGFFRGAGQKTRELQEFSRNIENFLDRGVHEKPRLCALLCPLGI